MMDEPTTMTRLGLPIDRYRWIRPALALVLFATAFFPRVIYPVSRPAQWYVRSTRFIHDVTRGAWGDTIYSEHPGVTTMWLSGIALWLAGVAPERGLDSADVDPGLPTAREVAVGVFPLAMGVSALILLMYGLLARLFDRMGAFAAALLVALDPFFIANSKVLHVDGLLTALMSSSALAMLVFLREKRWRWVILSGVLGGLALLTKSPAMFLLPYVALCLGVGSLTDRDNGISWRDAVLGGLGWLAVACLVYAALYPAMWADPLGTPRIVYGWAALNIETVHQHPLYFLGQPIAEDPGPAYYLFTWGCKLTAVVSVLAVVGLLAAAIGRGFPRRGRVTVGLILAFALFFTLQMMIGAKKMPRYLLPAFPAVDILAGLGLTWWAAWMSKPKSPAPDLQSRFTYVLLIVVCLLLQAAFVLPHHPHYGTHFNELIGDRTAIWALSTQWQGEGLDIMARKLNREPGVGQQIAASHIPTFFQQYFVGRTVDVDEPTDWIVFGINNAMRNEGSEEGEEWDFYRRRRPWATVAFDGIPYAWGYRAASGPQNLTAFAFGRTIQLIGYDLAPPPYHPGQSLRLLLYWQALEAPAEDYTVFVHALDGSDELIAQQDNPPVRGTRPTSAWEPGEVVVDPYDLPIPEDLPPGEVRVIVGLYRWPEGTRLPVRGVEGEPLPEDRVALTSVSVQREGSMPTIWIARALACLVLLGVVLAYRGRGG
jgi:hypothetical protein